MSEREQRRCRCGKSLKDNEALCEVCANEYFDFDPGECDE